MRFFVFTLLYIAQLFAETSLQVEVRGVTQSEGSVHVALYTPDEPFASMTEHFRHRILDGPPYRARFDDLPEGRYAVALFQDGNGNDVLDTNFLGAPTEPYGFSNNVKPLFSTPGFEACSFETRDTTSLVIDLIH